jgi:catechol 2,3-dioxygenase-like lactoylglutathione lyase family enzyme
MLRIDGLVTLLQVFDMPRALAFYRDVLGFNLVAQAPPGDDFDWGLLERDGVRLMLNTAYEKPNRPPSPDSARVAAHADTCLFLECPDVDGAYAHLCSLGLAPEPPRVAPYGMKQLSLCDPDGYGICLQWPERA